MPLVVLSVCRLLPARRVGVSRPPCLGGPTPPPGARALRRSSGRRAGARRGSPRASASSTPLPEVSSTLPDVSTPLPGVLSMPSCGSQAALFVLLGWQPVVAAAAVLACVDATVRVALGSSGRGWTLWRRTSCFFCCAAARPGQNGASSASPPRHAHHLSSSGAIGVWLSHRLSTWPRKGHFGQSGDPCRA